MGTKWSEIITEHAMVFIDDVRLSEKAEENYALFLREMSLYMKNAVPVFDRPPEMRDYLSVGMTEARYTDAQWTSTIESLGDATTVETGNIGYDAFSCAIRETQADGTVILTPYDGAEYDRETGDVSFPAQKDIGIEYDMDFYADGEFPHDLSAAQKRILGLCVACVWDERFFRDWLKDAPKVHDRSFNAPNEAQYMEKGNKKKLQNRGLLNEELSKYAQDCEYANVFRGRRGRFELI